MIKQNVKGYVLREQEIEGKKQFDKILSNMDLCFQLFLMFKNIQVKQKKRKSSNKSQRQEKKCKMQA